MFKDLWQSVMNPDQNALKGFPKPVKFQLMTTLAMMWSIIFCVSAGVLTWLPGYVFAHIALILIGLFGTAWTFKATKTNNQKSCVTIPATHRNPDRV